MSRPTRLAAVALFALASFSVVGIAVGEEKPVKDEKKTAGPTIVKMSKLQFNPEEVTIKKGSAVRWENNDDRDYLIMAKDQSFKSENLRPKAKFEHTFKDTGKFEYFNVYRPRNTGTVTVTD